MIEVTRKDNCLNIKDWNSIITKIDFENNQVIIDWYLLDFPWEYEKSLILAEIKSYQDKLFYILNIDFLKFLIIFDDNFDIKEEIVSFFWDVDFLFINTSKNSQVITESIESKVVIPFWEFKDIYLNSIWQHKEWISSFKVKSKDLLSDNTEYINLI